MRNLRYSRPISLDETLNLLVGEGASASVFAGGMDLILQIKQGLISLASVLDVKNVPELNRLEWTEAGGLHIGAAVPLSRLIEDPIVSERFGLLAESCSMIGSAQIRNRGTLGGNICNAAPSADSAPALLCLGAKAVLASKNGTRKIDINDFFQAPSKTCLVAGELLVEIEIPTPSPHSAGCYIRHTTRKEMDIAVAGVATLLTVSRGNRTLTQVRISLGAAAPTPLRAYGAERVLADKAPTQKAIEEAAEKAMEEADPISDIRASAEYRREMVKVLVCRSLRRSVEMLGIEIARS